MYTIKRAAELTGISLSTLRAWERRYGVVSPARSDGRYRLYSDADLRALGIMASLVHEGWSAREAAAETKARISALETRVGALEQAFSTTAGYPEATPAPNVVVSESLSDE